MKIIYTIVLTLLPALGFSQDTATIQDQPFKGAKKIICTYNEAGLPLLDGIARKLVKEGFTIDKIDKEYLVLTTEDKEVKHVRYSVRMSADGNVLTVSSKWKPTHTVELWGVKAGESYYDTGYAKSKKNIENTIFTQLLKFLEGTGYLTIGFKK